MNRHSLLGQPHCSGSLWLRNIQLGLYGTVLGLIGVYVTDFEAVCLELSNMPM